MYRKVDYPRHKSDWNAQNNNVFTKLFFVPPFTTNQNIILYSGGMNAPSHPNIGSLGRRAAQNREDEACRSADQV
jgi:hypothetical protein